MTVVSVPVLAANQLQSAPDSGNRSSITSGTGTDGVSESAEMPLDVVEQSSTFVPDQRSSGTDGVRSSTRMPSNATKQTTADSGIQSTSSTAGTNAAARMSSVRADSVSVNQTVSSLFGNFCEDDFGKYLFLYQMIPFPPLVCFCSYL